MMRRKSSSSSLRHRILLQQETETADGAGGYIRSWMNVAHVWAEIIPARGRETVFARKVQAEVTHIIRVRYRNDITAKHRFVFGSRIFSIHIVRNIEEMGDLLEITAVEGDQS